MHISLSPTDKVPEEGFVDQGLEMELLILLCKVLAPLSEYCKS